MPNQWYMGFRPALNFRKFKAALNPMYRISLTLPKVACYSAYQHSIIRKKVTVPFLKYKRLKLKLRVFLAAHSVVMVTYCVTKIISICPVIRQFIMAHQNLRLGKSWKLFWATLNDNFECDSLNELSDNNLASELVENRSFFKPVIIEEIVIFMIT